MTYDEALAFWYGRVNYELQPPQPGDLKLDRMRALLHRLGDPHDRLTTVHVAGSKGKGSTCAMLASVLRRAGYRTGLFTSPHLDRRRRAHPGRRRADRPGRTRRAHGRDRGRRSRAGGGRPAADVLRDRHGPRLPALRCARGCDIAVIEVGLGGRFDSTNVCTPLVSVITSISFDHTQMLGDTVEQIAFEKAGIIKPGVPVVSGVTDAAARAEIGRVAAERSAPLVQLGTNFDLGNWKIGGIMFDPDWLTRHGFEPNNCYVVTSRNKWTFTVRLPGKHQAHNAAVAVAVIEQLQGQAMAITENAVITGMAEVQWPARSEVFDTEPRAFLDCAHNVSSAEALMTTLRCSFLPRDHVLIFAVSADKDVPGMLRVLAPQFRRFYLTRYQQSTRAVPPEELAAMLPPDVERVVCPTPADAWHAAVADATPETLVVIAGSVFLAGELRPLLVRASGVA